MTIALLTGIVNCLVFSREVVAETDSTEVIPWERRIHWDPGIPGGIPEITGPVKSIMDLGADPTGKKDSRSAIISTINALPASGGVVFIPEGTFRVGSKISTDRDGIVFRGTGWKSKLLSEADGESFEIITYRRGTWQDLPQGAAKDSLSLLVEDGSRFTPGEFAEIEQENDSLLMYTDPTWIVSWAENSVGQLFEVESVQGNEVTFTTPVHYDFSVDLNARIRPQGFVKQVGFEDLYIEKMVASGHTIMFKNAAYCWVRNVESSHTRRTHVHKTTCLGNTIRDSYFHGSFSYGGGGSGYGVECHFHTTGALVENNIFDSLRHAMIIQAGANGNVYGYNYSINPVQGDGETNLNIGWDPPDISIHGHYPYMNLLEGNEVEEIGISDYWGPAGPGNTYFRNRVNGEGIIYRDASHGQNLVGNVTTSLKDNDGTSNQKLEHGNVVNGTVIWDPGITGQDLPWSYYLDSVPGFFETLPWPTFGPDIALGEKLPAQERFENLPYLVFTHDGSPVGQYEKLEFTIENGKTYTNPFDPDEADIFGTFIAPSDKTLKVNAFWDGDSWKLRFAGDETGTWTYTITVLDADGTEQKPGSFQVTDSEHHGWIGPSDRDSHYLEYSDGTPFYGIGMAVPWLVYDSRYYQQPDLLSGLSRYGVNFINWLFTSWDVLLLRESYETYSMEDALEFDRLIADAEQQDIKLLLGIWIHDLLRDDPHPWSGFYDWESNPFNQLTGVDEFFSDSASWEYQKKYYRYIIARWGYSSSVGMWHMVAEINGTNAIYDPVAMKNDENGWHNKINSYFIENDPFGHPTTVSGSGGYDFSEGWEITGVPQAHEYPYPPDKLKENPDRIAYWADKLFQAYQKPALVGEFGKSVYEEGKSESFLHNGIWAGFMSGACATPLHWWGGQIASQPENFSTFNETMMNQLLYLSYFAEKIQLAEHNFSTLYSAPAGEQISLSGMPEGKVYGLKGDSLMLCWIYHVFETSDQDFSDVGVSVPGLAEGRYAVSFYNTWEGVWYSEDLEVNTEDGLLQFTCPAFTGDVAFSIEYTGPVDHTGDRREYSGRPRIYPNPCGDHLHVELPVHVGLPGQVELPGHVQSIGLMNGSGQEIQVPRSVHGNRISFDLSGCSRGIYLLKIREKSGSLSSHKIVRL